MAFIRSVRTFFLSGLADGVGGRFRLDVVITSVGESDQELPPGAVVLPPSESIAGGKVNSKSLSDRLSEVKVGDGGGDCPRYDESSPSESIDKLSLSVS